MELSHVLIESFRVEDVRPGEKRRFWLQALPGLAQPFDLPALVIRGPRPGPTLLAVAGVHGDEFEGMEAIRQFFADVNPAELSGTLIGLPICNPPAYLAMSRASPPSMDGLNLARVFPGRPDGLPTERLAFKLLEWIKQILTPADLFIDLHSGSVECEYARMVGFRAVENGARARSEEAARHFGFARLWEIASREETLNGAVALAGIPTVGAEVTGRGGCLPEDVEAYVRGLWSMARLQGNLPGSPEPPVVGAARRTRLVYAEASGLFRSRVRHVGERVGGGELLGTVVDPFGRVLAEVRAPTGGEIWALRRFGTVWAGDYVAMIATHRDTEKKGGNEQ